MIYHSGDIKYHSGEYWSYAWWPVCWSCIDDPQTRERLGWTTSEGAD